MTRRLSPRELALYELLKHSPRNRALERLIILVCMFWCLTFLLIDKIIELRSRSRQSPDVVGSNRGGADAEGAMGSETFSEVQNVVSPPSEALPQLLFGRRER